MRLQILAHHVQQIATEPIGTEFTLSPCDSVRVKVAILSEDNVRINGRWAGNRSGAIQEFIRIVDSAQPKIEFDHVAPTT